MKDVLEEINRDRSDTWSEYNETDWKEGWEHWIEGDGYYTMVDPALTCTYPFASDDDDEFLISRTYRRAKMKDLKQGVVIFEDDHVVSVLTGFKSPSSNRKTGEMLQQTNMFKHEKPVEAARNLNDETVCGACPHRWFSQDSGATGCYVNLGQQVHQFGMLGAEALMRQSLIRKFIRML